MTEAFERRRIIGMAANIMKGMTWRHPLAPEMLSWVEENKDILRTPADLRMNFEIKETLAPRSLWTKARDLVEDRRAALKSARPGLIETHLQRVGELFGLDALERAILGLAVAYASQKEAESLIDMTAGAELRGPALVAKLLRARQDAVFKRLDKGSRLGSTGLMEMGISLKRYADLFNVSDGLLRALSPPRKNVAAMRQALLGPVPRAELLWEDFDHLAEQRDFLARLLRGAAKSDETGLNVLVYGPPGTGKTEFCKVVAERLGFALYPVGECDEDGDQPTRGERLRSLKMHQMLLSGQPEALVLVDEMEDLFGQFGQERFSRVFAHRALETNPRPVLWTCNHIESFDQAILRRMAMVIEVKTPTPRVRERVWARVLKSQRLSLGSEEIRLLSREFEAPPAVAAAAARAARLADGGWPEIRMLVRGVSKVLTGREVLDTTAGETTFDPGLARADHDLASLAELLARNGSRRFSLCLAGPSGTGKSAYARFLAERLGLPVLSKRGSDLLAPYVGETERAIARAFAQAREEGALMVFDEADSLLSERAGASRVWEVSQVNEMLTWMESHPLPFVCTTNLMERLDRACLRRFTFKVRFDSLPPEQIRLAFRRFFGLESPARLLSGAVELTPGDFALVARKALLLGTSEDASALAAMLEAEALARPRGTAKAIGFSCGAPKDALVPFLGNTLEQ